MPKNEIQKEIFMRMHLRLRTAGKTTERIAKRNINKDAFKAGMDAKKIKERIEKRNINEDAF